MNLISKTTISADGPDYNIKDAVLKIEIPISFYDCDEQDLENMDVCINDQFYQEYDQKQWHLDCFNNGVAGLLKCALAESIETPYRNEYGNETVPISPTTNVARAIIESKDRIDKCRVYHNEHTKPKVEIVRND